MVTYDEYDQILFSNDSFGQHYASSKRFDDEVGLPEVLVQAKKYYANLGSAGDDGGVRRDLG